MARCRPATTGGWARTCIGSHYAVRTSALKQIGGLGPELAEDHSTTLLMNAGGWRGVHAVDAIAHGLGPETFADLAVQEFQWSRSLVTILLQYTPALPGAAAASAASSSSSIRSSGTRCSSLTMLLGVIMPIAALALRLHLRQRLYFEFLGHCMPMGLVLIATGLRAGGRAAPIGPLTPRS